MPIDSSIPDVALGRAIPARTTAGRLCPSPPFTGISVYIFAMSCMRSSLCAHSVRGRGRSQFRIVAGAYPSCTPILCMLRTVRAVADAPRAARDNKNKATRSADHNSDASSSVATMTVASSALAAGRSSDVAQDDGWCSQLSCTISREDALTPSATLVDTS